MNDDPDRELALFIGVLKPAPRERAAYLEQECGNDKKLKRRLEGLLRAHDRLGNFLEEPPTRGAANEIS